jgi:hypothetical protein
MSKLEKRSLELYKGLSPKEKGILAFKLAIEDNVKEHEKLKSTVEHHTYRMLDAGVGDWFNYLFTVGQCLAADFWKSYALVLAAMLRARIADDDDRPTVTETLETVEYFEKHKIGVYKAAEKLCLEHGADFEAVKRIGGISGLETFVLGGNADDETVDYYLDILRRNAPK